MSIYVPVGGVEMLTFCFFRHIPVSINIIMNLILRNIYYEILHYNNLCLLDSSESTIRKQTIPSMQKFKSAIQDEWKKNQSRNRKK